MLVGEVEVLGVNLVIVLVYLDTRDTERNGGIYREMDRKMAEIPEGEGRIVLGDFNGHVGFIGEHDLNRNGQMMLDFMERWNLVMLNADSRCEGKYTRVQGNERSIIDYALVDENIYTRFESMKVDEEKNNYDLSDHCYIELKETRVKRKDCGW